MRVHRRYEIPTDVSQRIAESTFEELAARDLDWDDFEQLDREEQKQILGAIQDHRITKEDLDHVARAAWSETYEQRMAELRLEQQLWSRWRHWAESLRWWVRGLRYSRLGPVCCRLGYHSWCPWVEENIVGDYDRIGRACEICDRSERTDDV